MKPFIFPRHFFGVTDFVSNYWELQFVGKRFFKPNATAVLSIFADRTLILNENFSGS